MIKKIISGSFLVAGTAIGAGMLGIPIVTGEAGFIPAALITILVWGFMLITGLFFLEVTLKMPHGSNILSITQAYLGHTGKCLAGGMFVFLYYCLVVAYIAGGSPLLGGIWEHFGVEIHFILQYIIFTFAVAAVVYCGVKCVDRINIILTISMFTAYILMFLNGASAVSSERLLGTAHFGEMFLAVPILFSAFGYHNVIPSLCDYLKRDRKALKLSLIIGTATALIVYLAWQYLVIGSIDASILKQEMLMGNTAVSALQKASGNASLYLYGKWFGALALLTSLLGVSLSMVDFFSDGVQLFSIKVNRFFICVITFIPPLIFTIYNPQVFTQALGLAGGIGEAALNGLLPVALVWVSQYALKQPFQEEKIDYNKLLLLFIFILGIGVMGIELYDLVKL